LAQPFNSYSKTEKDIIKKIDYINKPYQFLNETFQIVDNYSGEKSLNQLNFENDKTYKDSLRTVLKYNLESDYAVHLAFHRILTPWERTSFYLWKSIENTKKVAESFGFSHPYLFYQYLISEDTDKKKKKLLLKLRKKLSRELQTEDTFETNKQLLKYAFKNNPDREQAMKAYFKEQAKNHKH
jgi:hypothetical protein